MLLVVFIYISLLAFVIISASKAIKFAKMPMHSRWELYPVPKEKGKGEYGGSYYEEIKWYEKPHEVSHGVEIKEMLKEMIFIKNLYVNQRQLWWLSFSLHMGIYMLFLWTLTLVVGAITELAGTPVDASAQGWAYLIYVVTLISGIVGGVMVAVGSAGLFLRRYLTGTMKKYSTPQDFFNLVFIFAVALTGLLVASSDLGFQYGREIFKGLFTFSPIDGVGGLLTLHIILLGLLLIYIPMTKMSHYVAKYFTFHKVLWENDPNLPGSDVEKKVEEASKAVPKNPWAAPHINPAAPKEE